MLSDKLHSSLVTQLWLMTFIRHRLYGEMKEFTDYAVSCKTDQKQMENKTLLSFKISNLLLMAPPFCDYNETLWRHGILFKYEQTL